MNRLIQENLLKFAGLTFKIPSLKSYYMPKSFTHSNGLAWNLYDFLQKSVNYQTNKDINGGTQYMNKKNGSGRGKCVQC